MATMVHDRFQVTRHGSGFQCSFPRLQDAMRFCQEHIYRTELTIFDAMAHHGKPEMWDGKGIIISFRPSKPPNS